MTYERSKQPSIIRRLDAALEDMACEGLTPSLFHLTEHDWLKFDEAASIAWGGPVKAFSHRDVQILALELAPPNLPSRYQGRSLIVAGDGTVRPVPKAAAR